MQRSGLPHEGAVFCSKEARHQGTLISQGTSFEDSKPLPTDGTGAKYLYASIAVLFNFALHFLLEIAEISLAIASSGKSSVDSK